MPLAIDFAFSDIVLIGFLAFLEAILSIDNAIVLALMARHLPRKQQRRALTYGLVGSIVFRLSALAVATSLIHWRGIKYLGGAYLIYIALEHGIRGGEDEEKAKEKEKRLEGAGFWKTVVMIELMDIVFAIDSILAAVAITQKIWIVFLGGMMGVVLMRFAATGFLSLLRRYPGLERTAYELVFIIGVKLVLDAMDLAWLEFDHPTSPASLVFWAIMALSLIGGFFRKPKQHAN